MDFYSKAQLNIAPTLFRAACIYLTTHGTKGIQLKIVMKDTSTPKPFIKVGQSYVNPQREYSNYNFVLTYLLTYSMVQSPS